MIQDRLKRRNEHMMPHEKHILVKSGFSVSTHVYETKFLFSLFCP